MIRTVRAKQPNSKMCFVCGLENTFGLKGRFFELENDEVVAIFNPCQQHQGYPGRLHGGIAAAILDEIIARAIMCKYSSDIWGVTIDFSMRFKKPIPLDGEIQVVGRIDKDSKRMFEGSGDIRVGQKEIAVTAKGKYMKMDISTITEERFVEESWEVTNMEDDPSQFQV